MSWAYLYRSNVVGDIIKHSYRRGMLRGSQYVLTSAVNHDTPSISQPFPGSLHTPKYLHRSYIHTSACHCSDELNENRQPNNEDNHDDGDEGTTQEKKESVIDRLRRLSMSSPEDYELSPMAKTKAVEMAQVRKETRRKGEEWKWDQQNLRDWVPQGAPRRQNQYQQPRHRNRYDPDGDEEEFDNRINRSRSQRDFNYNHSGEGRSYNNEFGNYNSTRGNWREQQHQQQQHSRHEMEDESNDPEDYEVEMQNLRDRIQQNKASRTAAEDRIANLRQSSPHSDKSSDISARHDSHPENASQYQDSLGNINTTRNVGQDHPIAEDDVSFVQIAKNPDSFGNLLIGSKLVKDEVGIAIMKELNEEAKALSINAEEESDDSKLIPLRGIRWNTDKLIQTSRDLLQEKKLKEAVDLYLGVLAEGGFDFDNHKLRHHFLVLINECATVGYVDMAFRLYNLMKKRGYREKHNTISSLLNACANSPWDKEKNMEKIEKLLINVKERGFDLNEINYLALIKAYGRLSEIVLAFDVVDKMINDPQIKIGANAFNLLLQACITDTKNGFRHTLVTWRKMQSMKVRPDIYSFNALLRAVRDCGIDISYAVNNVPSAVSLPRPEEQIWLPPIVSEVDSNLVLQAICSENPNETPQQLMISHNGESKSIDTKSLIKSLRIPENRFAVLGGLKGFLVEMVRCKVGPNLKTFTQLLEVIKPEEIPDVLHLLKLYKIKPDVTFYAVAISRSSMFRKDELVKELVRQMSLYNISPNIVVWGALSKSCKTWTDAKNLLSEMSQAHFNPNIEVMISLLLAAIANDDPKYVLHVMEETRKREIPLGKNFLSILEDFYQTTQRRMVDKELGKPLPAKFEAAIERYPDFSKDFSIFKMRYPTWLNSVVVKVEPENPWKEDFENFRKYKKHAPPESETTEDTDSEEDQDMINK